MIGQIRDICQRWLDGDLSQEDALFAIADLLDREATLGPATEPRPCEGPIVVQENA